MINPKSVLIVDDEPDICTALSTVCNRHGWQATTAPNAMVALEILENNYFKTVITDIIMPEKDGVTLIAEIRERWPDVSIIAISGGGDQGPTAYKPRAITTNSFLHAAQDAGAQQTLTKPFSVKDIQSALDSSCVTQD